MSIIKPFRGIRYDPGSAGDLVGVVAPPYDIITPGMKNRLHERSPYNVIRLILGDDQPDDDTRRNKYARAAALWEEWLKNGVLVRDPAPSIYRYMTGFDIKTPEGIVSLSRPGFVALLKLYEYSEGKVLPHERTLAGPKHDRFQLMSHTHAHFSQVFMLYPDPDGSVEGAFGGGPPDDCEVWTTEDDAGVMHTMWPVTDREVINAVTAHLEREPIYIADGHHRYETSLAYRRHLMDNSPLFAGGSDYIMAYFTPVEHPGLVIFPYHRLLHNLPKSRFKGLLKKLNQYFQVDRTLLRPLDQGAPRREFMSALEERGAERTVFGMVDGAGKQAFFLSLRPDAALNKNAGTEIESFISRLDVVLLEKLILIGMLGIKPRDLLNEKFVGYETDYDRVLDAVQKPPNQTVFLMNPTPVSDVIRAADLKGIMPEKSTYFFPKVATGLVMNAMDED
jgi:uncharacterized protein (DUF1015 family)